MFFSFCLRTTKRVYIHSIYTVYINKNACFLSMEGSLSYGYPMDMVWLSYGISTKLARIWHYIGTMRALYSG